MAVNWLWKNHMGEIVYSRKEVKMKPLKVDIYAGNCLGVLIYHFTQVDEATGKKQKMYNFQGFWDDTIHLEKCLGLRKTYDGELTDIYKQNYHQPLIRIRLNVWFSDSMKIAKLFAKAGHKVELYYKEIK